MTRNDRRRSERVGAGRLLVGVVLVAVGRGVDVPCRGVRFSPLGCGVRDGPAAVGVRAVGRVERPRLFGEIGELDGCFLERGDVPVEVLEMLLEERVLDRGTPRIRS